MNRSRHAIDHQLAEIIGNGDISHLPGAGQPLQLNDDPHTPPDQRAAQKIMRDHNVTPAWIEIGNDLSKRENILLAELRDRTERHYEDMNAADDVHKAILRMRWSRYRADFHERVSRHNREALLYNLQAPTGIPHKPILNADHLLDQALSSVKQAP